MSMGDGKQLFEWEKDVKHIENMMNFRGFYMDFKVPDFSTEPFGTIWGFECLLKVRPLECRRDPVPRDLFFQDTMQNSCASERLEWDAQHFWHTWSKLVELWNLQIFAPSQAMAEKLGSTIPPKICKNPREPSFPPAVAGIY